MNQPETQKCPSCDGTGIDLNFLYTSAEPLMIVCTDCWGAGTHATFATEQVKRLRAWAEIPE